MSNSDIGKHIRQLRDKHELTLEQVGNRVGVGKSTVRKWETGEIANMRRDKIDKLAEALHTSPAFLMGWTDNPSPNHLSFVGTFEYKDMLPIDDRIKKASIPRDPLQDREVLFALFGETENITPDMIKDVKAFARFVHQQKAQSQVKGKDGPES